MFEKEAEEYAEETKTEKEIEVLNTVHDWGQESLSPNERKLFEGIQDRKEAREQGFKDGAEFGYNKANEWQTGEPIKGREIFARNIANCNLLATYFDGAWRNVWNGGIIDFDKIIKWRYTGFKNNGEEIVLPELKESE